MMFGRGFTTELRARTLNAEEMLLLAVLEQAVADLDHSCAAVRADADAYVFTTRDHSLFSFDSVCAYFKLSPSAVRQALRRRHRRRVAASSPDHRKAA